MNKERKKTKAFNEVIKVLLGTFAAATTMLAFIVYAGQFDTLTLAFQVSLLLTVATMVIFIFTKE